MDPTLDHAPCGFLHVGDDGYVIEANTTVCEMVLADRGKLAGQHVDRLFSAASRIFYQTHVFPTIKLQGTVHEVYLSFLDARGEEVPVLLNAVRRAVDGRFESHWVVVPMRQRNQYENEILKARSTAEAALRAKDDFLAVVSHELKSPLSAIDGWAHVLSSGSLDAPGAARALEAIKRNVRHQVRLVDDLLDFGRVGAGKLRLQVAPTELGPVVREAIEGIGPAAKGKGIRLDSVLDSRSALVSGDPDRLLQVLWNMLSNAVKFTPRAGRVQVRLERVNSSIEISVSDTGRGISAEFLPHVFERFRQEGEGRAGREGGLGLGMAISSQLVELHGGTIRAASEGVGKGATFTIRLPLLVASAQAVRDRETLANPLQGMLPEDAAAASLAGLDLIVVDNEPEARELLQSLLGRAGAEVRCAGGVEEALALYRQRRPHVLLSDIEMEGGDGYALVRRIREMERGSTQRTPAIALTARTRDADRLRTLSAGFQVHLPKPVNPVELVLAVANLAQPSR
jgi:signal transduction histidine kinase/CheY-like chemotaxis protein